VRRGLQVLYGYLRLSISDAEPILTQYHQCLTCLLLLACYISIHTIEYTRLVCLHRNNLIFSAPFHQSNNLASRQGRYLPVLLQITNNSDHSANKPYRTHLSTNYVSNPPKRHKKKESTIARTRQHKVAYTSILSISSSDSTNALLNNNKTDF